MTTPALELEADLAELRRLSLLARQLEPLAHLHERAAIGCNGECKYPVTIYVHMEGDSALTITCCNLKPPFERYQLKRRLIKHVREKVERGRTALQEREAQGQRRELVRELNLSQTFPRDFTGTFIMRKLNVPEEVMRESSSDPEVIT